MKYNLVRNGSLQPLLSSGTGNIDLTWLQLESLMDGNLTSSGVSITTSGILYLETDLSQRIKVDGIRLYTDDLSKSTDIKFYYKNVESDIYTILTTQSGASYYYTTISDPSAPQFIRVTISGVDMDIYEFQVFNDDYIVAFGQDGSQYSEYLDNTPVGEIGGVESIAIYNNDTSAMPANAYTCVDYTGSEADYYLEISSNENGTFYDLTDGVILEDNDANSTYTWNMGKFNNTKIDSNILKLSSITHTFVNIPLIDNDECFNTGSNTWDWDRVNKKVYVMGKDSAVLKLWEFKYKTNEWVYLSELNPLGSIQDNFPVMSYCSTSGSRRVYAMTQLNGGFGYYDFSGSQDNWTSCANPGWSFTLDSNDRISMCSDGVRYIYSLTSDYGSHNINRNFKRFDTISGTWSVLNSNYDQPSSGSSSSGWSNNTCMTYDYNRGWIYLVEHSEEYSGNIKVQRYNIAADSWNISYIDIISVFSTSYAVHSITYHNNWIYVSCNPYFSNYFFRYNVATAEVEKLYLGYKHYDPNVNNPGVYILAIDGPTYNSFGSTVLFGQIDGHRTQILIYNPFYIGDTNNYTTPIFDAIDKYKLSYFIIEGTATSGTGSISHDPNVYNGTIQTRSSDTKPITINKIFWSRVGDEYVDLRDVYTGTITDNIIDVGGSSDDYIKNICINRRNGRIAVSWRYYNQYMSRVAVYGVDHSKIDTIISNSNQIYTFNIAMDFDNDNGIWGYGTQNGASYAYYLIRINNNYDDTSCNIHTGSDFLYDFAVEWDGTGLWYTDKIDNVVKHINYKGQLLNSAALNSPRGICITVDNGCWVSDNTAEKIYRYSEGGVLLDTLDYTTIDITSISRMVKDFDNGFWFFNGDGVGHINEGKVVDLFIEITNISRIRAGHKCCITFSYTNDRVNFIDLDAGVTTMVWNAGHTGCTIPGLMSFSYEDYIDNNDTQHIIPGSYDLIWGSNGSLEWVEVRKDGYFLPKHRYQQAKITLQGDAEVSRIIMAPAVEIEDIQPQSSKNMYVRTNIPTGADITEYETKLKTWWGVEA